MAVIETWLRQDLKGLVTVRSLQGQVFSLDNGGNLIGVKVTKDGRPVTLTGTVTGYCILSDGQTVTVTGSGSSGIQNGNEAYIVLPQLVYSVPGQISIVIKLTSGSVTTTLAACTGYVYRSRTSNEVVPPGTPIPDLATMEEVIRRATAATDAANTAATGAEKVDAAMTKEGDVITIAVTDRDGNVTEKTVTDQTEAMKQKADINGVYPDLTAGTAEQLVSTQYVENAEAYTLRPTGGSADVGNREYLEKIIGGTVCWNQVIKNGDFSDGTTDWSGVGLTLSVANGFCTCTARSDATNASRLRQALASTANHKYMLCATIRSDTTAAYQFYLGGTLFVTGTATPNEWVTVASLKNADATNGYLNLYCARNGSLPEGNTFDFKNICVFDLTAMFGPTIADYVYDLETATPGAGVAWFRRYFPNDYYEYNPGELISVSGLQSHDTVGFNAWDEKWELGAYNTSTGAKQSSTSGIRSKNSFKVIPGTRYSLTKPTTNQIFGLFYDDSGKLVVYVKKEGDTGAYNSSARFASASAKVTFTVPDGATQMRLRIDDATVYNHDICVNLVHSGTRDGEYEPYEKHSYPLDSTLTLRGVPKLDENGNLYFDGDEYASDGMVTRRYGVIDLGEKTWNYYDDDRAAFYANLNGKLRTTENIIISGYTFVGTTNTSNRALTMQSLTFASMTSNDAILIKNTDYTDATAFKNAMSGIIAVFELAAPTTEQAEPYTEVQICSDWGTEEFVSDSILPVGHLTQYPANLRDKLQHLPSLADTDGDYIVRQTGSQMSLVGLGDTAEVTEIKNDISELRATASAQGIFIETESLPIVSISDGADDQPMKAVNVAIEPVQDLHGYEYPWPAGGGKNLIPPIKTTTNCNVTFSQDGDYINISGTPSGNAYCVLLDDVVLPAGTYTFNGVTGASNASYRTGLKIADTTSWTYNSESQRTFTLEAESKVRIALFVYPAYGTFDNFKVQYQLERGDTVTPWTPYSNVCPITGWTGAKVTRTGGKNLFDIGLLNLSPVTVVDGVATGKATNFTNAFSSGIPNLNIPKNTQLTWSIDAKTDANASSTGNGLMFQIIYSDGTRTRKSASNSATDYERITLTSDASKVVSEIAISYGTSGSNIWYVKNVQLEISSTATDYEPYLGNTYEVTFPANPGTVYGGTLDVASGKLVVDRAGALLNDPDKWVASTGTTTTFNYAYSFDDRKKDYGNSFGGLSCSYMVVGTASTVITARWTSTTGLYFGLRWPDGTLDQVKADALAGKIGIVYVLASPIVITLTPTEIKTLLGINNVWSDAGNTSITYPADTKTYIDNRINASRRLIAGIETGFTASKMYAVGDMLIIGDDLYKVTAQIASGATITVGTNVTKTTVAEQLIALANA